MPWVATGVYPGARAGAGIDGIDMLFAIEVSSTDLDGQTRCVPGGAAKINFDTVQTKQTAFALRPNSNWRTVLVHDRGIGNNQAVVGDRDASGNLLRGDFGTSRIAAPVRIYTGVGPPR
jgi:hypothetical protein